ncbi:unnamed protein product [Brassica oleracea var. botrytis]|uniref:(rape) hypothetical protein n=1 Tax=Brassica napus TaxID=3708 RepID=A0A816UDT3_BRANA|nr:unnamed protein product [Brassica napus]
MDTPIPNELLDSVDILILSETELIRLAGMHTETLEQFNQAVAKCHKAVNIINQNHMCCRHHSTSVEHLYETTLIPPRRFQSYAKVFVLSQDGTCCGFHGRLEKEKVKTQLRETTSQYFRVVYEKISFRKFACKRIVNVEADL